MTISKPAAISIAAIGALASAYLLGAYSFARNIWPIEELRSVKNQIVGQPPGQAIAPPTRRTVSGPDFDQNGRLKEYAGKKEVPCPAQSDKTAVLLIAGQSNAGNHAGQRTAISLDPARKKLLWNG